LALKVKTKPSPSLTPPKHVLVNVPVGHVASAARTQCSQRPLETVIVAPDTTGLSVNLEVPDAPTVDVGSPSQNSMDPAIPPQTE
jgi:hypothetical protein